MPHPGPSKGASVLVGGIDLPGAKKLPPRELLHAAMLHEAPGGGAATTGLRQDSVGTGTAQEENWSAASFLTRSLVFGFRFWSSSS